MAPGRVAVDLPADTAPGLTGVAIGDRVDLYSEMAVVDQTGKSVASSVGPVAKGAVLIGTPNNNNDKQTGPVEKGAYIVAVSPDEQKNVADSAVRGKKFTVFLLPSKGGQ
ncbi:MAG: hypothetical protein A4E53_01473 [Pelotomaculum sp. PtaB.Bin104]|nr:MAG: hypothetical protein A4E53_01473 [Pelotomaculum sp. PtaB.Bin104]